MAASTTTDDDLGASLVQRLGQSAANARTATRDEDCVPGQFHDYFIVSVSGVDLLIPVSMKMQ
jgi:hypothetical protein